MTFAPPASTSPDPATATDGGDQGRAPRTDRGAAVRRRGLDDRVAGRAGAGGSGRGAPVTRPGAFLGAVNALLPPPCEVPARCAHHATCARGQACPAFRRYTASGHRQIVREPWETPSTAVYLLVFPGQDNEEDST